LNTNDFIKTITPDISAYFKLISVKIIVMKTLSVFLVLALLSSCKHESVHTDNTVIIGDSNRNYTIIKPDPEILITATHQDSLDLNSDGIFEIKFVISPIQTSTVPGSKTEIITNNQLQILLSYNQYEDPDTLSFQSILKNDLHWSDIETELSENVFHLFSLRSYACYTYMHCLGSGNFENVYGKYIGYKIEEKFGWILVDSYTSELKIKEYTVLK
jgi:hypothetical protein